MKTQWAHLYTQCQSCGTTNKPHKGKGLCTTCYYQAYERPNPPQRKDTLERFVNDLPILLNKMGAIGFTANYDNGTVIIKKIGTKMSVKWPER